MENCTLRKLKWRVLNKIATQKIATHEDRDPGPNPLERPR